MHLSKLLPPEAAQRCMQAGMRKVPFELMLIHFIIKVEMLSINISKMTSFVVYLNLWIESIVIPYSYTGTILGRIG